MGKRIKIICVLSIIIFVSNFDITSMADECVKTNIKMEEQKKLSELDEDELLEKMLDMGLEIPEDIQKSEYMSEILVDTIKCVENDSNYEPAYNMTSVQEFAKNITGIVKNYYIKNNGGQLLKWNNNGISLLASTYTLVYSRAYTTWRDTYYTYNCYGFAIGKTIDENPGYWSNYNITVNSSIQTIVNATLADLRKLGYTNVASYTSMPTQSSGEKLIIVRKGNYDYHFMKYTAGKFRHKPGSTLPLELKPDYKPWNHIWTNENINRYGESNPGNVTYNSSIYYIKYK